MGESARAFARTLAWEKRAEHVAGLYDEVLARPHRHEVEAICR